jgi:hypothetical protein
MSSRLKTLLLICLTMMFISYCGSDDSKDDTDDLQIVGPPGDETFFFYAPQAYLDPATQIAQPGDTVSITGVGSFDPNCELNENKEGGYFDQCPMTFDWAQTAGESVDFQYSSAHNTAISFVVPDTMETMAFKLVVSKESAGEQYYSFPATAYVGINRPPTISLPEFLEVDANEEVFLRVVVSDPDDNDLNVRWTQSIGPRVILSENDSTAAVETSFIASWKVGTMYRFSVSVDDGIATTIASIGVQVFADADKKLFVSASADVIDPDGSRNKPYSDLSAALAVALADGKDLILASGNYTGTLELTDEIGIYGGYNSFDWSRDTKANLTRIIADRSVGGVFTPLVVSGATGNVVLDGLFLLATGAESSRAAALYAHDSGPLLVYGCRLDGGDGSGSSYGLLADNLAGSDSLIAINNFIYSGTGTESTAIAVSNIDAELHFNTLVGGAATVSAVGIDLTASSTARLYSNLIDLYDTSPSVDAVAIAVNDATTDILNATGFGGVSNIYGAEICFSSLLGTYHGDNYCEDNVDMGFQGEGNSLTWYYVFKEGLFLRPPYFVDKAAGDYHLSDYCYGIANLATDLLPNLAVPIDWDIDGNDRGDGFYTRYDVGADEYIEE